MYQINITDLAKSDLRNAAVYISEELHNPTAANRFLDTATEKISFLAEQPFSNALVSDSLLAANGIRFQLINKYLAFYVIREETQSITIIRIIHSRRDWISILKNNNF